MENQDLFPQFMAFINSHKMIDKDEKVLLAISGGVDSMVMLHLFKLSGFDVHVAHCNFSLRGIASHADEKLVEKFAFENAIPFHSKTFDTIKLAADQKISIQLAARNARYAWFNEIMEKEKIQKLATAHHLDDNIETFFINLNRGTGIKGLKGIPWMSNNIIRPMILFRKEEIYSYAQQNEILFREDESNKDSKYLRNWFRNKLIPLWQKKNPSFSTNMQENMKIISRQVALYEQWMMNELEDLKSQLKKGQISIISILALSDPAILLFELFHEYGFSFSDMEQLVETLKSHNPGKKFLTAEYCIFIDREFISLKRNSKKDPEYWINKIEDVQNLPVKLRINTYNKSSRFKLETSENILQVDANKVKFPLHFRKWQKGDSFQPLGMNGKKKISDYLIDEKTPLANKEEIWLLLSSGKIMWIIGKRMDNRFKLDENTTEIMEIKVL